MDGEPGAAGAGGDGAAVAAVDDEADPLDAYMATLGREAEEMAAAVDRDALSTYIKARKERSRNLRYAQESEFLEEAPALGTRGVPGARVERMLTLLAESRLTDVGIGEQRIDAPPDSRTKMIALRELWHRDPVIFVGALLGDCSSQLCHSPAR